MRFVPPTFTVLNPSLAATKPPKGTSAPESVPHRRRGRKKKISLVGVGDDLITPKLQFFPQPCCEHARSDKPPSAHQGCARMYRLLAKYEDKRAIADKWRERSREENYNSLFEK